MFCSKRVGERAPARESKRQHDKGDTVAEESWERVYGPSRPLKICLHQVDKTELACILMSAYRLGQTGKDFATITCTDPDESASVLLQERGLSGCVLCRFRKKQDGTYVFNFYRGGW